MSYNDHTTYVGGQYPPTPTYSHSGSPIVTSYRSGNESDRSQRSHHSQQSHRSHRSQHSNGSSSRRRPSSTLYTDGLRVSSHGERPQYIYSSSPRREGERYLFVNNPPTPRTPPQPYDMPRTAPTSPNVYSTSPRESYRHRPMTVDDRPRVQIEINSPPRSSKSSRQPSHSRSSHTSASEDEERRRLRRQQREASSSHSGSVVFEDGDDFAREQQKREKQERREEKNRREELLRAEKIKERINKANEEIDSRPVTRPVPKHLKKPVVRNSPSSSSSSSKPRAPSPPKHNMPTPNASTEELLSDGMRKISLSPAEREEKKARLRALRAEDDAQRARLSERILPQRRASIASGTRRPRIYYEDGVSRYE